MASDTTAGVRTNTWRLRLPAWRLAPWAVSWLQVGPLALVLLVLFALPTLHLYLSSLRFTVIVWAIALLLGFSVAHFLVFHVRSGTVRMGLFLLCAIPFWTSGIIRTIAWIPFLKRVDIQALGWVKAPFREASDVVGSADVEGPAVGADAAASAGQAG